MIFILENTIFHMGSTVYTNTTRDIGKDGIFRDTALDHESSPYTATRRYFGYEYGLEDWIFAGTIFWSGKETTFQYSKDLLLSDPPGNALVISFTEMGLWGAADEETMQVFQTGTSAVMEAIEKYGDLPIV